VVARDYAGFTDATEPSGGFVLPATTSVLVVVKVQDSALRPPQFVGGPHGSFGVVDGAWSAAPARYRSGPWRVTSAGATST
jgi:hypothetical protein